LADFEAFYRDQLVPALAPLEEQRRRALGRVAVASPIVAGVGAVALLFVPAELWDALLELAPAWVWLGGAAALLFLLTAGVVWGASRGGYVRQFKETAIPAIARFVDPGLAFVAARGIDQRTFEASGIFSQEPDRYRSEDLVFGTVGRTTLEFSEVLAEKKHKDSKGRTSWSTIFRGVFLVADFNKHFHGETVVRPDFAERLLGRFGQALQGLGNSTLVKLEDPEFERAFVVHSSDQVEARYILSPALMQRILAFSAKVKTRPALSFCQSRLFLALSESRNLFEPPLFGSLLALGLFTTYLRDLELAVGVVEDLNLNTRIWSKS
jgi:hypothetical protein